MQKLTQKWCIVSLLQTIPEGAEFHWKNWPLHITFAPTFAVGLSGDRIVEMLKLKLAGQGSMNSIALDEVTWATKVRIIKKTDEMEALHRSLISTLEDNGAVFNEPQYIADNYVPHATFQKDSGLQEGDEVYINNLALVDMFPGADGLKRKIVKIFELK